MEGEEADLFRFFIRRDGHWRCYMGDIKRKASFVKLALELVEQSIVLVFVELKLAALEVKHNINSAKNGAVFLGLGGFLLLFSLLGVMTTAIAALALVLPVWLSALIVTATLLVAGGALLFMGLSKLKHFTLVPRETVDRVETIANKLKKHAEERERAELEAHQAAEREAAARHAAHEAAREAREQGRLAREQAKEQARKQAKEVREHVRQAQHQARLAREHAEARAREEREARRKRA